MQEQCSPPSQPVVEPAGLYVHVPFCSGKCMYCDFYSVTDQGRSEEWAEAVLREAYLLRGAFGQFDTLYLGGGSPSLLAIRTLEKLLHVLRRDLPFSPETEITLEVNPEDVQADTLSAYRDLGVNRISLGVQSLNNRELAFLGRRHSVSQARRALEYVMDAGFHSVSVDLIYGLPGQEFRGWMETLRSVTLCGPHHISCYELTAHPRTPLGRRVAAGRTRLPGENEIAAFFLGTAQRLEDEGFVHYEVSNFARSGHKSRHNRKYWRRVPYLGLGPGAHSFLHPTRWWNPPCLETWLQRLRQGEQPAEGRESLTPEQDLLERLWLGFRTCDGLEWSDFNGVMEAERIARQLERSGLVTRRGRRMVSTTRGFLVSDSLPLLFAA